MDAIEKLLNELALIRDELAIQREKNERGVLDLKLAKDEVSHQKGEIEKQASGFILASNLIRLQSIENEEKASALKATNELLFFQLCEKEKLLADLDFVNRKQDYYDIAKDKRAEEWEMACIANDFQKAADSKGKKGSLNSDLPVPSSDFYDQYSKEIMEACLDPLLTMGTGGKIIDVNEASLRVTGVSRDQLIGKEFFFYFADNQKARQVFSEVFSGRIVVDSPMAIRHISGKLTEVLFSGSAFRDNIGNIVGVVIASRFVTPRTIASEYARSLIEASLDPLFTINLKGKITDVNNASVNITGKSRNELMGTDFFDYFTDPKMAREVYKGVFANGFVSNYPLTIIDDKLTDVLFNGSVYKDDCGNVLGVVVVARDITEQKRAANELTEAIVFAELATGIAENAKTNAEKATTIAESAVKAKQQFLSNMSHEIRTPMNAIIGFTKVLLKSDLTAKQKEYLMAIKMSGDALIVLINDILDLAKVDAGKMVFEQTPFKMALSIAAMLHLFETKIQEKNLELVKEYDEKIPEVLVGDPVRLHQIILNLVSNAVKFTSEGRITVSVRLICEDSERVSIEFAVMDTGIGIPEKNIDKIFDNFQQASSGTSRLYGGTGLGLAIVKQLVESQGGEINVKSQPGGGSTFSFCLKFEKTDAGAEVEEVMAVPDTEKMNIRVLVVEDIPLNQLLIKTLLDDYGFEREVAENGKVAIEKLLNSRYDIILMDLQMPVMNGFETTDYIRNTLKSSVPIIALTADVTTVDLAKCKAVGMNDYIPKPVDERLLYTKIMSLVKRPSLVESVQITSHTTMLKSRCTDLDYLRHRTKSNPKLMEEMISAYLVQTPPLIFAMKQGMLMKNWDSLYSAVHKMIPSFSIMGISVDFENMAKRVQEFANTQLLSDDIPDLVLQIELICLKACVELEEELKKLK